VPIFLSLFQRGQKKDYTSSLSFPGELTIFLYLEMSLGLSIRELLVKEIDLVRYPFFLLPQKLEFV